MDLILSAAIVVGVYYLLALGMHFQYGISGLMNLGVHGFFAVGAYTYGLLTQTPTAQTAFAMGLGPYPAAIIAVVVTGLACGLVVLPSLFTDPRTRGVFLVPITTLAAAEVFVAFISANNAFAGGFAGLVGLPQPFLEASFKLGPSGFLIVYTFLALATAVLATGIVALFQSSGFGRRLRATRDDEVEVRALGYGTVGHQFAAFVLGGALMGAAGVLWAAYIGSLQPSSFTIFETLLVLIAVIIGGRGRLPGVALGAVLVFGVLNQVTRQLPTEIIAVFPGARQVIIGLALIAILMIRPQGVLPERFRHYPAPNPDPVSTEL